MVITPSAVEPPAFEPPPDALPEPPPQPVKAVTQRAPAIKAANNRFFMVILLLSVMYPPAGAGLLLDGSYYTRFAAIPERTFTTRSRILLPDLALCRTPYGCAAAKPTFFVLFWDNFVFRGSRSGKPVPRSSTAWADVVK